MNYILMIILLFGVNLPTLEASEIRGRISTNPKDMITIENPSDDEAAYPDKKNGGGGNISYFPGQFFLKSNIAKLEKVDDEKEIEYVSVLGISRFADYSLLRGTDMKIYVTEGGYKFHLKNHDGLKRYKGQKIFKVSDTELENYPTREYMNGALIREKGKMKIFHIENAKPVYVKNLQELGIYFGGQEIHNVDPVLMPKYFE